MGLAIDVVKRSGKRATEAFDREKLYRSVLAACLSVRSPEGEAETTARNVADAVIIWCEPRATVTSRDLRRIAGAHLSRYHPEAAYFYQQHRIII